jgi:hypothetical protein
MRRHYDRQNAQTTLRAAIALWAGWQRQLGREDSEAYRRFFFTYGTDVATAQTLGAREAGELHARIAKHLNEQGVIAHE